MKNSVMTSHLPFPDIRALYRQSCVFTLDHSQRVFHTLVYNCASSFSVKLKMSHCALPAPFPDILRGQVASEKDTCPFGRKHAETESDGFKDASDL